LYLQSDKQNGEQKKDEADEERRDAEEGIILAKRIIG
jgi:hypothetical protein